MVNLNDDKYIFAAYANMAQHNFEMAVNHIAKAMRVDDNELQSIASRGNTMEKEKLRALLTKHFPFLAPFTEKPKGKKDPKPVRAENNEIDVVPASCKVLAEYLFELAAIIGYHRNTTTHFCAVETDDIIRNERKRENTLSGKLAKLWLISIRIAKTRFSFANEAVFFLQQKGKDDSTYTYRLWDEDNGKKTLSKRGLIFFLALFLEKKYIKEMLDKLKGEFCTEADLCNPLRLTIIFETMAIYRMRLPRVRYDSERPTTALAFDMLNELQRCPAELFDTLTPDYQQLFYTEAEGDECNPQSVLMKRYSDRFPTLALKYIDQQAIFDDIRFQIELGNYHFAFYDKQCVDGVTQVRSLVKPLHGYGRLDDMERWRRDWWGERKRMIRFFDDSAPVNAESEPYITDHHASYLIANGKVGMYWNEGGPKDWQQPFNNGVILPKLPDEPKSKKLRERKKEGETIVKLTSPRCFLSTYELPSLVFYHLLRKRLDGDKLKAWPSAEEIIKKQTKAYIDFWTGIESGAIDRTNAKVKAAELGLRMADLPRKMLQYFEDNADDDARRRSRLLRGRLDKQIADTEDLIDRYQKMMERIGSDLNKRGKRGFKEFKPGEIGAWLAHDIMAMQPVPTDGSHKLTSLNFRVLQASLSVYESADSVRRALAAAGLLIGDFAHPFLLRVTRDNCDTLAKFYQCYLEEKRRWLRTIPAGADLRQYGFIARGVNKWDDRDDHYFIRLAGYYLDLPVELPRGIFAQPVKDLLRALYGESFVKGDRRNEANVSFLIDKYHRTVMRDDYQPFFTQRDGAFGRCYHFFALLRGGEKKVPQPLSVAQIEKFLASEPLLWMLKENLNHDATVVNSVAAGSALMKMAEQVRIKLEKARAKNPSLNVEARITEIIASAPSMASLSDAEREAVAAIAQGRSEIERHLNAIVDKKEHDDERNRLARSLRYMNENEKQLRRIRINDIITFYMAKDILDEEENAAVSEVSNDISFKLRNVKPIKLQKSESLLEITVPFSITLKLRINGQEQKVTIKQNAIKLKNYGDFNLFLHDSRISTLIPYIINSPAAVTVTINKEDLEKEFSNYDSKRVDVFANVHKIERLIIETYNKKIGANEKKIEEVTFDDNGKSRPLVNNFSRLLDHFPTEVSDADKREMVNIRNSFSHNAYSSREGVKVNINTSRLGEIAPAIADKMDRKAKIVDF